MLLLPSKSMCIIYMLCIGLLHIWQCKTIAFLYHLWLIFCPCHFVFILYTKFYSLWNQYTDSTELYSLVTSYSLSSVDWIWSEFSTLHSELYSLDLCWVWSVINTVQWLWTVLCTWNSQLCWPGYIKADIWGTDQIWWNYIEESMTLFCRELL